VILPAKLLDALLQDEEQEDLKFLSSENHLFFASVHAQITATQVAGVFPAWQKVIPRDKNMVVIPVHRDAWLYAIKRVALASGELKAVTIQFEPGFMTLSTVSSTHGDASEKIAIEYTRGPLTVTTKWTHLVEFLEVAEQAVVNIHLKEESGIPIKQVILDDGPGHMQVVNLMVK
jgi:DNA polymerase-3 subunit beta